MLGLFLEREMFIELGTPHATPSRFRRLSCVSDLKGCTKGEQVQNCQMSQAAANGEIGDYAHLTQESVNAPMSSDLSPS
jgi:hypothetical protein